MVRTRRQTAVGREALITSAMEHPVVWDFVGKGRYLQAAVSKFYAQLYKSRFDSITSKTLSNIAAEAGVLPLLSWTRSIGCNWGDSVFLSAVKGGRTETLEYLINNDCPVPQGEDACTCAAKEGRLEVLIWLREREAAWGEAVCTQAAAGGFLQVLVWALENRCSFNREEALAFAAGAGHLHILEWVKNLLGAEMLTPFLCRWAAKGGRLDILQQLRAWNCPWDQGCIWLAVAEDRVDVFHWAKANGCPYDVNEEADDGTTLLNFAIRRGHVEMIKVLLADGASVHHTNAEGSGYLHLAAECNRCDIAQVLIGAGANVNARDRERVTPLFTAVMLGHLEFMKVLCDAGADLEASWGEISPLYLAMSENHAEAIKLLIERGARADKTYGEGFSALHVVCQKGFSEAASALIQCGADVNMIVGTSISPLYLSCANEDLKLVAVLLENGADANLGVPSPLMMSIIQGYVGVVEALIAGGCNLNAHLELGGYLNAAIIMGNLDMVTCLVRGGADLNPPLPQEVRPLNTARTSGFTEIATFLAEAGARE